MCVYVRARVRACVCVCLAPSGGNRNSTISGQELYQMGSGTPPDGDRSSNRWRQELHQMRTRALPGRKGSSTGWGQELHQVGTGAPPDRDRSSTRWEQVLCQIGTGAPPCGGQEHLGDKSSIRWHRSHVIPAIPASDCQPPGNLLLTQSLWQSIWRAVAEIQSHSMTLDDWSCCPRARDKMVLGLYMVANRLIN